MPTPLIKSFSKKSGKSEKEVEKIWDETKKEVKEKFKNESPSFWAYVNKIVQHKLGIKESSKITFKQFIS
jgi:hypothetical protein